MPAQADISLVYDQASIKFEVSDFSECLSEVDEAYRLAYSHGIVTTQLTINTARYQAICHSGMGNFEEAIQRYNSIAEFHQSYAFINNFAESLIRCL